MATHTSRQIKTKPADSGSFDSLSLSSPTRPAVAHHLRFRAARLSQAIPSIERIIAFRRRCGEAIPESILPLYGSAMVELAAIRGELGVLDEMRVERLAETMACPLAVAHRLWKEKKALAERHTAEQHARAVHKLMHQGTAKVWHVELVDLRDVSVAFDLREADKRAIFPKGWKSGLRSVNGPPRVAFLREKVAYTAEQRKDWCHRLGFASDTLSENARTLGEDEFLARIAKREADLLPPKRLEGRKLPGESDWHASRRIRKEGPKTRRRVRGIMAERRDLASELGVHPDTVKKKTKDMTVEQIQALRGDPMRAAGAIGLSLRGPSTPNKNVRSTPDTGQKIGHLPLEDVSDHAAPTGSAQNKNGDLVTASVPACKATRNERGPYAYSYAYGVEEAQIIHRWHEAKRGRALTEEAARKWHVRGTFERKFFEACEWIIDQTLPDDDDGSDSTRATAEFWIAAYREKDRKRRASARGSRLMPKWMRDYARAVENEAATTVEITPVTAQVEAASQADPGD